MASSFNVPVSLIVHASQTVECLLRSHEVRAERIDALVMPAPPPPPQQQQQQQPERALKWQHDEEQDPGRDASPSFQISYHFTSSGFGQAGRQPPK